MINILNLVDSGSDNDSHIEKSSIKSKTKRESQNLNNSNCILEIRRNNERMSVIPSQFKKKYGYFDYFKERDC